MIDELKTYLALGDSMSIDFYTGVPKGGAVSQFHKSLGSSWRLVDKTADGCRIERVPTRERGEIITLTIGGNDVLSLLTRPDEEAMRRIIQAHQALLRKIRARNPSSCFIVGNVYAPDCSLAQKYLDLINMLNAGIAENVSACGGQLADIYAAFDGHSGEYLCRQIEPNLTGATVIAELFSQQYKSCL